MDLYVYYRVANTDTGPLAPRVAGMQRRLAQEYGVAAALKRRPEEKEGRQTWMEVYQAVPDGFVTLLERAVARAGLSGLIDGPRHVECFVDVAACA